MDRRTGRAGGSPARAMEAKVVSALTLSDGRLHSFGLDDCMRVTDLGAGGGQRRTASP